MKSSKKQGIYLVANLKSQEMCANLIFSIRSSGCKLPIRLIHFGGEKLNSDYILNEVEFLQAEDFPKEGLSFINLIRSVVTDCPLGFLYRFLALFSDWDEFIYSDNDIVALNNWELFFEYLPVYDIVHADEEYITEGRFNFIEPTEVKRIFGEDALLSGITAGHFAMKKTPKIIEDLGSAIQWFKENEGIPQKHDQALLHIAALIGNWKALNLCKPTHNWLSSWGGDYKNPLAIIQAIQAVPARNISHLHYSGFTPKGERAIDELIFSNLPDKTRLSKITSAGLKKASGTTYVKTQWKRVVRRLNKKK